MYSSDHFILFPRLCGHSGAQALSNKNKRWNIDLSVELQYLVAEAQHACIGAQAVFWLTHPPRHARFARRASSHHKRSVCHVTEQLNQQCSFCREDERWNDTRREIQRPFPRVVLFYKQIGSGHAPCVSKVTLPDLA